MTARLRLLVLSPLLLIVLIVSAACPLVARADEAAPPPPEGTEVIAAEEAAPLDPPEPGTTEDVAPTESIDVPPAGPAPLEAPPDETAEEPASTEATTEAEAVENIVADLPEGTDLVVLDENGEALPLASVAAAEIIVSGDPMWCPAGQIPGDDDCTDSYATLGGTGGPIGLLDAMLNHAYDACETAQTPAAWCSSGAGTIYIAADYNANSEFNPWAIAIDSEDVASYDIPSHTYTHYYGDLVVQGGWDFAINAHPEGAVTTFAYPLTVDWRSDITLNDLVFTGVTTGGPALTVTADGDITLNRVDLHDNESAGAYLDNCLNDGSGTCLGTGSIEINDSSFNHHYEETPLYYNRTGLEASSGASITLNNVEASDNELRGVSLHKFGTGAGLISITDSVFAGNLVSGLLVEGNNIELDTVLASGNGWLWGWQGAVLNNCVEIGSAVICPEDGYIHVTDSTFVHNGDTGLDAKSVGNISISGTTIEHNGWVDLNSDGDIDAGETPGLESYGAYLDNCLYDDDLEGCAGSGVIEITGSSFNDNQAAGLKAYSSGAISMILSEASGNGVEDDPGFWDRGGAALNNEDAEGSPGILVDESNFLRNYGVGLFAHSLGDITVTDSGANLNGSAATDGWWDDSKGAGALLDNCALFMYARDEWGCRGSGSVTVENSSFEQNAETGLYVETFGAITLGEVHANSNGVFGAELMNDRMGTGGTRSTGAISITGPSTFGTQAEPNGGTGLWFESYGNATLSDIVASYNGFADVDDMYAGYGINGYIEGEGVSINVSNVTTNGNVEDGLMLGAYAETDHSSGPALGITLIDVVANANGYDGADIATDGGVWVDPSTFSANGYDGLFIGAFEALVECSTFTGNGDDGLVAAVDGTITLAGCTFGGNGDDDFNVWEGDLVITAGDCPGSGGSGGGEGDDEREPPAPPTIPPSTGGTEGLNVVGDVGEQQVVDLVCTGIAGTVLQLTNGDHIELPCPIEGRATLHHQGEDTLPAGLADGVTYVSGLHLGMAPDPEAVQGLGGTISLHFTVPDDLRAEALLVMHWDNGKWEQLSGSLSADGFFEAPHGQSGIYVLAAG